MSDHPERRPTPEVASAVRSHAGSAGVAAALLLLFGFYGFAIPDIKTTFDLGDALSTCTMRAGGIGLLLAAVGCATGRPIALLLDSVVSIATGVLLATSAVLMIVGAGGAGLNQMLYIVFGIVFVSAGWRNGVLFMQLRGVKLPPTQPHNEPGFSAREAQAAREQRAAREAHAARADERSAPRPARTPDQPPAPSGSLAGELLQRRSATRETPAPVSPPSSQPPPARPPVVEHRIAPLASSEPTPPAKRDTPPDDELPPEGFLASFGTDNDPNRS
jgi:hypothetical protein